MKVKRWNSNDITANIIRTHAMSEMLKENTTLTSLNLRGEGQRREKERKNDE